MSVESSYFVCFVSWWRDGACWAGTYTDVGEDGIDDGDLEPSLAGPVVRSVDCREGTFGVVMTPLFEVIWRTFAGADWLLGVVERNGDWKGQ